MGLISYVKTIWKAGKSGGTPFTPERFNNIEDGIEQATNELNNKEKRITDLETDVSQINSDLNIVYDTFSNSEYLTGNVYAYKYVKICQLSYSNDRLKIDKEKFVELFILPERYRPTQRIVSKIRATNSDYAWLFVDHDGLVRYYSEIASSAIINFQFHVMYLTDK